MGGGFAMAEGTKKSGLNDLIGNQLEHLDSLPDIAVLFIILVLTAVLTSIASNAASASMLLPIINNLAIKINVSILSPEKTFQGSHKNKNLGNFSKLIDPSSPEISWKIEIGNYLKLNDSSPSKSLPFLF